MTRPTPNTDPLVAFREAVSVPDSDLDLLVAALLLSGAERGQPVRVAEYIRKFERLVAPMAHEVRHSSDPMEALSILNRRLFDELGFQGNVDAYYDPANSYMDAVIDSRLGIPITLSIVYMEAAKRAGLNVVGIAMPGHFMVRLETLGRGIMVDPFHAGKILDPPQFEKYFASYGMPDSIREKILTGATARSILVRMLRNLRAAYLRDERFERALGACDRILIVDPSQDADLRDRGVLYCRLGQYYLALKDLSQYLKRRPNAADYDLISDIVKALRLEVQSGSR
ncbi:MAG: tetratricopeptide repeat protein [Myxococcales bacterium]|nr:tetratricopeptide repeat protein [Myxococcales bacterium]